MVRAPNSAFIYPNVILNNEYFHTNNFQAPNFLKGLYSCTEHTRDRHLSPNIYQTERAPNSAFRYPNVILKIEYFHTNNFRAPNFLTELYSCTEHTRDRHLSTNICQIERAPNSVFRYPNIILKNEYFHINNFRAPNFLTVLYSWSDHTRDRHLSPNIYQTERAPNSAFRYSNIILNNEYFHTNNFGAPNFLTGLYSCTENTRD